MPGDQEKPNTPPRPPSGEPTMADMLRMIGDLAKSVTALTKQAQQPAQPGHPGQPPVDPRDAARKGLKGQTAKSMNAIRDELARMPKMRINVPRPQHIKKGMFYSIPVTINGYTMTVPTGCFSSVPMEVYLILVRGGHIGPMRDEDMHEVPAFITMDGPEYLLMEGGTGSMSNPIPVG